MIKKVLALVFVLTFFWSMPGFAQETLKLPSAEVDLWPEYDQPSMLIIEHLTLPPTATLPAEMTVHIPASAGKPSAGPAARQPDGTLFNLPYDVKVDGQMLAITFRATTAEVQIEYYDDSLQKNGNSRHFEYQWPGDYAVDSLVMQVQQPFDATNMKISPSLGSGKAGNGLTYYTAEVGSLAAGQTFKLTVDYQKPSDVLSITQIEVQPSAPLSEAGGGLSLQSILPWLLAGLGLLLIAGGGLWYWQSGRVHPQAAQRARRRAVKPAEEAAPADSDYIYCHQCGKRAAPGDRFCRTCGTPLRAQ